MKIKLTFLTFSLLFLAACSNNKDYAYNQKTTSNYYLTSKIFEGIYQKFVDGEYKTNYEWDNEFKGNDLLTDANGLKANSEAHLAQIESLERSADTDKFHENVSLFFKKVGGDFVNALHSYAEIDCDCKEKKDSISNVITSLYGEISSIEDKALEEQKAWFEKAGFKGEEKK
ncbi:hypothetical protein [Dysgonomonas sp. 520]|uniref:hypothetical protein n=1 Tax=Dysgonomonas sp. 520 TaxID=2302931 RepID=UPI0013D5F8A3|nr:hypothetical protein [Dysgonomonas sp. 520]NDW08418.1 hypothetical protein [Dysgonomonas sp. 520]